MKRLIPFVLALLTFGSCGEPETTTNNTSDNDSTATPESKVVNVYTHRHYDVDKELFTEFTKQTGIEVNVLKAKADELMVRMANEGELSPCDLFITVDAANLVQAQEKGYLQAISSDIMNANVPAQYRSKDGFWYAQTLRSRVIVYSKEHTNLEDVSTYEGLTHPNWRGKVLVRSSNNVYNQSLLASIIEHKGSEAALAWAKGMVNNFATDPKGGDRDQIKFIASERGDVALVNTYYIGQMLNSTDEAELEAVNSIGIAFPNQEGRGAHVNISGAGVAAHAPNKAYAIKLLEFLSQPEAQARFAEANYEYPVHPDVPMSDLLKSWGAFKADTIPLELLGKRNAEAISIFDQAGWK